MNEFVKVRRMLFFKCFKSKQVKNWGFFTKKKLMTQIFNFNNLKLYSMRCVTCIFFKNNEW